MEFIDKLKSKINNLDFIMVTGSTVFCAGMSFLYSVLAKRYIGTLDYGIYSTCLLLQTYLNYVQFGVYNAYNRDMPRLMGGQEIEESRRLKETTLTFMWLVYAGAGILAAAVLFIMRATGSFEQFVLALNGHDAAILAEAGVTDKYFIGFILVLFVVILENTASFSLSTSKIYGRFNYSAFANVLKTLIAFPVALIGAIHWGYYGLYLMPLSSAVLMIILYYRDGIKGIRLKIDRAILKNSIVTGIPLMIDSLIWTIMQSVDKFVILIFMTTEDLGLYTVPLLGFTTMVLVPQTISNVFYIKISNEYGAHHDLSRMMRLCNKYTRINSLCTSAVAVVCFYALPILVQLVMPMYVEGTLPAQVLLIGVAIYGSAMLYSNIFSVMKWNMDLVINSVILCVCNIIFSSGMVLIFGREIQNVALGTSISYAAYSLLMLIKLSRRTDMKTKDFLTASWIPILMVIVPAVLLYYILPNIYIAFAITLVILAAEAVYVYKTLIAGTNEDI